MYGLFGASGCYPCLYCLVYNHNMATPVSVRGRAPSRTFEAICADHQHYIASEANKQQAKHFHNCITEPIFNIPISQVCPPGLHITLGVFIKLYGLLEDECHNLTLSWLCIQDGDDTARIWNAIRIRFRERYVGDKIASWIISVLEKLPPISAESIHVINDLVECVYREHSAAATGQLKVRKEIIAELQTIVQSVMPDVVVRLFGSSETGFALNTSDVNIFLDFPDISGNRCEVMKKFLSLTQSKSEIYDSVEEDLFAWNKIPHILLRHKASGLLCDVRIMDSQPASIATLLNKYASIDERVVKLVTVFRYWAKLCQVDLQENGHYPAHMFAIMVVHYLQQLQPPVLPVLHELIERDRGRRDTEVLQPFDNTYLSDLSDLSAKWTCKNHESLGALWYGLLRYYGLDFKMKQFAVSILQLAPLQKSKREWMSRRLATSSYKLVVEETHQTADAAGKKKHGPKPSPPCDELHQSKTNNTRVPYSLLCLLAGMSIVIMGALEVMVQEVLVEDAAVAGLLEQSMTEGSKRKQQEMEMTEGTGCGTNDNIDNNGEKWTEMDELDATEEEARDEDGFDGEESQLPNDLANSLNVNHALWSYYSDTV
eukprot:Em0011g652a